MSLDPLYLDLQLRFASRFAALAGVSLSNAITKCTNLRRRFNLWGASGESDWAAFLQKVRSCAEQELLPLAVAACESAPRTRESPFGCFGYEPPDVRGTLRIHFMPEERHRSTSPLSESRIHERRQELQALIRDVKARHPEALQVRGLSWLYHLQAYQRLFPPQYVASLSAPSGPLHMNGSSTWGQVLDHRNKVKSRIADQVIAGLDATTVNEPWRAFPLQPLAASCSILHFVEWFA